MMRAVHAVHNSPPPELHMVFDVVYVRLTPELGTLLHLIYPECDFEIQEGINAKGAEE